MFGTVLEGFHHGQTNYLGKVLCWAEYHYNTSYHSAMGTTPFQAVYGRLPPTIPADVCGSTSLAIVETELWNMMKCWGNSSSNCVVDDINEATGRQPSKGDAISCWGSICTQTCTMYTNHGGSKVAPETLKALRWTFPCVGLSWTSGLQIPVATYQPHPSHIPCVPTQAASITSLVLTISRCQCLFAFWLPPGLLLSWTTKWSKY